MIVKQLNREESEADLQAYFAHLKPSSPLFQHLEAKFDKFIEESNPASEHAEMYYSDDAIFTKKGAIIQAIEHIFEMMDELNLKQISTESSELDFDGVWQY